LNGTNIKELQKILDDLQEKLYPKKKDVKLNQDTYLWEGNPDNIYVDGLYESFFAIF
jgi:hypothetical protein